MRLDEKNKIKQTIFITVSRAITARNLLLNNFITLLKEKYTVVLLVSKYQDEEFLNFFGDFIIEPLYEQEFFSWRKKLDVFLTSLGKALIYNPTIELRSYYGLKRRARVSFKKLRLFLQKYIIKPIFGYSFFRAIFRHINSLIFSCNQYDNLIEKYQPSLIFATSISDPNDVAVVHNARRKNIKTVGMLKSWDNASKFLLRVKTDTIVVWSEYMKEEVKKFQDYKTEEIKVVGVPQFDYYKNLVIPSKEEFFNKYKLDLSKKTIFFGSEGPVCEQDPYIVALLKKEIINGVLSDYQIFVRPHFSYPKDEERFLALKDDKIVFVDLEYDRSNFRDATALSLGNVINLMSAIKYSEVNITSASTLVLDIIANEKYPILYNFDQDKNLQHAQSVKRLYQSLWMQEILKIIPNSLVYNEMDLFDKIKMLEKNFDLELSSRNTVIDRFCYKIDGQSGYRLFDYIDQQVRKFI